MLTKSSLISCALLLATCLLSPSCKSAAPSPDASTATDASKETPAARTPSKLEQADWQSPPPGMPEASETP